MIGDNIRAELHRPLEGDRNWIRLEHGPFVHRQNPEHLARVVSEKARLRVAADIAMFRSTLNRRRCDSMLELLVVYDPFEGFHDERDFS